jgi:hypothetical protein
MSLEAASIHPETAALETQVFASVYPWFQTNSPLTVAHSGNDYCNSGGPDISGGSVQSNNWQNGGVLKVCAGGSDAVRYVNSGGGDGGCDSAGAGVAVVVRVSDTQRDIHASNPMDMTTTNGVAATDDDRSVAATYDGGGVAANALWETPLWGATTALRGVATDSGTSGGVAANALCIWETPLWGATTASKGVATDTSRGVTGGRNESDADKTLCERNGSELVQPTSNQTGKSLGPIARTETEI